MKQALIWWRLYSSSGPRIVVIQWLNSNWIDLAVEWWNRLLKAPRTSPPPRWRWPLDAPRWAVRGALLFCFGGFDLIINAGCKVTSSLRFFFWFLFIHIHRSMCCLHFHLIYVAIRTPLMLVFFFSMLALSLSRLVQNSHDSLAGQPIHSIIHQSNGDRRRRSSITTVRRRCSKTSPFSQDTAGFMLPSIHMDYLSLLILTVHFCCLLELIDVILCPSDFPVHSKYSSN